MSHATSKKKLLLALIGLVLLLAITIPQFIVRTNHRYSYTDSTELSNQLTVMPRVGIVFGGGIRNNQPAPVLRNRLLAANELYNSGVIDKIVVSGDRDSDSYDEPTVMYEYLIELGVPADVITIDSAGYSTYETCERAHRVFGVHEAVAITQTGHLERAIYLCRSFDINTYGYAAERAGSRLRVSQVIREIGSNIKAVFNILVYGERTVISEPNYL